jgi:biotin carboxyl carrier protein
MKFSIRIGEKDAALDLTRAGESCRFQLGGDAGRQADVVEAEPGVYSVLMAGRSYEARVEPGSGGLVVIIDGHRFDVEVRDPRQFRGKNARRGAEGLQMVTAPMPGRVVRVMASAGGAVTAGEPLMVVEAMKMQNELRAPRSGKVTSVPVREGDTVAAGDVLAIIE